jgi:hypothetical protein
MTEPRSLKLESGEAKPPIPLSSIPESGKGRGESPYLRISEKGVVERGDTPPVGVRFFGWVGVYIIGC